MLATTVNKDDVARLLTDDQFLTQLKCDGHRYLVEVTDGELMVYNRAGQPKTSMLSHAVLAQFEKFTTGHWVFDGELVDTKLWLFDLPIAGGIVTSATPFGERYDVLEVLMGEWAPDPKIIELLPCARTTDDKLAMLHTAETQQREGIILRHRAGLYAPGRRSNQLLKFKFVREADFIVTGVGHEGKDNATLSLIDPDAGTVVEVGRASTIGKGPVAVGEVWEARFLYVLDPASPRLYQPRLMRKRVDKDMSECLIDQLANAWTDKNLDDTKTRERM